MTSILRRAADAASNWVGSSGGAALSGPDALIGQVITVGKTAVRVERKLADGGYGSLYVVKSARTGRSAVLKRMLAPSPEMREQLISEARLLTRLSHPNILRCFGASSHTSPEGDATIIHILLELCSGGQLLSRVQSLPTRAAAADLADILVPVCCAVSYMHARDPPIAHRDLKFENVLLAGTARGRRLAAASVRLADFGSASTRQGVVSRAERPAEAERIERFTTPQYRSPEMVDLYCREPVDERVDIWALGCMLFLALFRCHPFPDGSSLAILSAKLRIPCGAPSYPKAVMFLLRACFLSKPDFRPTAASVARYLAALGGQAPPADAALDPARKAPVSPLERLSVPAEASSVLVSDSGAPLPPLLTSSGAPVLEVAPHALTGEEEAAAPRSRTGSRAAAEAPRARPSKGGAAAGAEGRAAARARSGKGGGMSAALKRRLHRSSQSQPAAAAVRGAPEVHGRARSSNAAAAAGGDFDPFAAQDAPTPARAAGQGASGPADDGFDDFEAAFGAGSSAGAGVGDDEDDFFGGGGSGNQSGGCGADDDFEAAFGASEAEGGAEGDDFDASFSSPSQPVGGGATAAEDDFEAAFGSSPTAGAGAEEDEEEDAFEASFGAPAPAPAARHPRSQSVTLPGPPAARHSRMQSARTQPAPSSHRRMQSARTQPERDPEPSAPPADPEEDLLGFGAAAPGDEEGEEDLLGAPEPSVPPAEAPAQYGGLPAHVLAYMSGGQMAQRQLGWPR